MASYFAPQHRRSQGTFLTVWKRPKDHQLEMMGETLTRAHVALTNTKINPDSAVPGSPSHRQKRASHQVRSGRTPAWRILPRRQPIKRCRPALGVSSKRCRRDGFDRGQRKLTAAVCAYLLNQSYVELVVATVGRFNERNAGVVEKNELERGKRAEQLDQVGAIPQALQAHPCEPG